VPSSNSPAPSSSFKPSRERPTGHDGSLLVQLGKAGSVELAGHLKAVKDKWNKAEAGSLFGVGGLQKKKCTHLSVDELTEWLKRTDLGTTLVRELGAESRVIFDALARRYEAVGQRFTESFRKHSRLWSTGVAFVLALVVNVDSISVLNAYLGYPEARQAVIAQSAAFEAAYKERGTPPAQDQTALAGTGSPPAGLAEANRKQLDLLLNSGLPVGLDRFPHACWLQRDSVACRGTKLELSWLRWMKWILGIVLTGLLAGLGSPFWYDAVAGLSRVVKNAGKVKGAKA